MTWKEVYRSYLNDLKLKKYSSSSQRLYISTLKPFKLFVDEKGITDLRQVTKKDIEDYQNRINDNKNNKLSSASRSLCIRGVKKLYSHLLDDNHILVNPCAEIPRQPSKPEKQKVIITPEEIAKIMSMPNTGDMTGFRNRAILELISSTGIRAGECAALLIYDIDLTEKLIKIKKSKWGDDRVIPLRSESIKWLKRYQQMIRPRVNRHKQHVRHFFLKITGNPMTIKTLGIMFNKYIKQAELSDRKITLHAFRYSFAAGQIKKGTDILTLQKLLGHKNIITTVKYVKRINSE